MRSSKWVGRLGVAGLLGLLAGWGVPGAQAQVAVTLTGPAQATSCGMVYVTNRFVNNGPTLNNLWITNELPSASYAYVPGLSTVTLPSGVVRTGVDADPDVNNNSTNLVWDFTGVATPSTVSHLLITEVFYHTGLVPEDDNEWIEIYNPTTNAVDLTGWSIRDTAPGAVDALPAATINPGEFIIVAANTNAFLAANPTYVGQLLEIADGKIGSGLNNFGDGVLLRDAASVTVDAVSYGSSTAGLSPSVPNVAAGRSIARSPADNDTNTRNDWTSQAVPDPGEGNLPVGMANGDVIEIVYAVEIDCGAISGQFFARAGFEQPPGTPGTGTGSLFLSVNIPDLVVVKTPIMQDAGFGDTVTWTVRVENAGFGGAENVMAVDRLGPGLEFTGFSVAPTWSDATNAVWDAAAIPAFTNLAAGAFVDIVVTAEVVSCVGLYNQADAQWGCSGLQVLANEICEDTSLINETATAGIRFIDRYPSLSYSLDPAPIPVAYCGGTDVTLYITNASGPDVGTAFEVTGTPVLPDGWTVSGDNVDGDGVIQIDDLAPGGTTAVVFRVEAGGACPIDLEEQNIYFRPYYEDACGNPFFGPLGVTTATVVDPTSASVVKIVPGSVSGDVGSFTVELEMTYENFTGIEGITLTDLFPVHTNLTVANISAGGTQTGDSIEWSFTNLVGSGVATASFDMVIGEVCGGPQGIRFNEVLASTYTDCQGCEQEVEGTGFRYPISFSYGAGCTDPGLTGGCSFVSSKGVFPELVEVCAPVMVTHTFSAFGGSLGDWTGVEFTADLAEGNGYVDTTNEVMVVIDGSNVTSYVAISQSAPSLVIDLGGLNGSSFPTVSNVATSLSIAYPVSVGAPGQYTDGSELFVPGCGTAGNEVTWNVGESLLEVDLMPIQVAGSCSPVPGRIDLTMLPSPEGVSGPTALFPAYDVEVTLDLDFDNDLFSGFEYVADSTVFSNLVDLMGTPIPVFEPAISGDQLVWNLGDLGTNTGMAIFYTLRKRCGEDSNAQHRVTAAYNNRCDSGTPQSEQAVSRTNGAALYAQPNLLTSLQPELQFLTDTQIVNQVRIMNSCAIDAYNLRVEMFLPANVSFGGAGIAPTTVTSSNVVWEFQGLPGPIGPLQDTDNDGEYDDLISQEVFEFWVTNNVDYCLADSEISMNVTYGCFGESCTTTPLRTARYETISGSLVTRATFPVENDLCEVNPVEYSVRNSGLTIDYDVETRQTLPAGMSYVTNSSQVSINGGATNAIGNPVGTGLPGDPLIWDSTLIPLLAAMDPNDQVTIFYEVALGCEVVTGDNRFIAEGVFTDLCGNRITNREVVSVLSPNEPLLTVDKSASVGVADLGEEVVYTVTISHAGSSAADVPYLTLTDVLPAAVDFDGASVPPDFISPDGQTLIWSNATLMALTDDTLSPFSQGETIQILVTGTVVSCSASVQNTAVVTYGCSESDACLTADDDVSIITSPRLTPPGLVSTMTLDTCGGTKTVTVTNSGATATNLVYSEWAPPGYIFTGASSSGEFSSPNLTVVYSGTPHRSVATVDFSTDVTSGATDAKDDIGNGLENLDLGKNSAFTVTWTLASAGDNLDCLADPTDLDFADPEQGDPSSLTSSNRVDYLDFCGESGIALGTNSAFADIPDLDIDLQPNSLIVTNGEVVPFTLTVINDSETADADGIYVRVKLGLGWTNVTFLGSNIVSSGTTTMYFEQQGDTNLLFDFPGVMLAPLNDQIELFFTAEVTQNGGTLDVYAEVVGDCGNGAITPSCTFTNTLGETAYVDDMTAAGPDVTGPLNGQYYSFDQDRFVAAGHTLSKTVRYDDEAAGAAGANRDARVGEDLIYRIEALYFGGEFSNVSITDSLPVELGFGTPTIISVGGGITNAVWDAGTGVFTLQPAVLATNPSTFAVDIPVVVSNRLDVQDDVIITNVATTDFTLNGVTNVPIERTTEVEIYEPVLQLTKTVNSNVVQAGDIIIFTNRLEHTAASRTSAYSIVFTDTLPAGVVFNAFIPPTAGSVAGQAITITTNDMAALGEFATNDAPIEFVFSVLVVDQLVGATMTNRSQATYVSLDNDSENGNERDGSGGIGDLNDYYTESEVTFTSQPIGALTKTFVSSTQTNTIDGATNDWTIGERFVYQIRVDVPQGVVSNLVLTDVVPAGIDWVGTNPDPAMAYPGRGYEFEIPAGGPQFPTNIVDGLGITDPDPTPDSSLTTDGSGLPITFTFPAITNAADGNAANDYFLLRLEFVALNQAVNTGLAPNPRRGSNVVTVADAFTTLGATGPVYRIVEHDVRAQKLRSPATADAGDVMTFTLIASNQVNALANAYDVLVTDVLSSNVYDFSTFTFVSVTPGWDTNLVGVAGGRRFEMFTLGDTALPPGAGATGVFTVALAQGVRPNQIYTNRMDIPESTTLYGPPPGGIAERNDTANNTVTFSVPGLAVAKVLESTSEVNDPPDSTNSFVQIGEVVTYRLSITLPESTVTNLTVVDQISSNGLAYVHGSARLDTNAFDGSTGDFTESPPSGGDPLAPMGQWMTFSFTNVVATGGAGTVSNTFDLLLDYLVLDEAANDGLPPNPTVHTNLATLTYAGNPSNAVESGTVTTTVIEPDLQIFKSLTPTNNVDAGDVISITLTVTNSGTATAYDVVIEDELALPYFNSSSITNIVAPTGFVHQVVGDVLRILSDTNAPTGTNTIEAGESLVFTFDVKTAGSLPPNTVVTNLAVVRGDSLASTNVWDVQRFTGDTNSATFTADDFDPVKILYATSETGPADSTGANLQIGEIATYEISVGLPEGTITDLQITDVMPAGMAYVVGSLVVITNDLGGTLAAVTNVTPNAPPLGASGENVVITWVGDTVLDATTNASSHILRLRLDAVVLDLPANAGLAPQTVLTNSASVTYAGNPNPPATVVGPPVTLIEPDIAIAKTVAPDSGDAGDQITVTLTATNSGLATAYDLDIADLLDGSIYDTGTVAEVTTPPGFVFAAVPSGSDVIVTWLSDTNSSQPTNTLEVGESLTFEFSVDLAQTVEPGGLYTNTVSLETDTIYETNAIGIQRSYTNDAQDSLTVSNMFIAKALTGTSATGPADSTNSYVQIGEIASYRLTVTLPESTITNLTVVDVVPAGMSYVAGSVSVDTTGFGGSLPGAPAVATLGGSGDDITIRFEGLTVVTNNNDGTDNSFAIEFDLLTLDVGGNTGTVAGAQTVLPNSATIAYDGNPPVHTSGVVNVTVIEPVLGITKTMGEASNSVVVIDLVVTNSGLATAFDVEIEDILTTVWWDTDTITQILVPDGFTFVVAGNPADATITIASNPLSSQPTNSIEAGESLLIRFSAVLIDGAPSPVTNVATITEYSSLDGPDSEERDYGPVDDEDVLEIPGYTLVKTRTSPLGRAAAVGETVTFDLVVANTGGVGLDPVPLEDRYDVAYLSYQGAVPVSDDNVDDGVINWANVGPLPVGGAVTVAVSFVAIESTWPGETTNFVVATPFTTNGLPLLPKTNEAPVDVVYAGYTLEKDRTSPVGRAAQVGEEIVFTITVVNTGEVALATLPVEDTYDTTYLTYGSSLPASDDNVNNGVINWTDIGPLAAGASTQIVATFTAAATTAGLSETNTVVTTPTTPPGAPPVPPKTNDAPYEIYLAGYTLEKDLLSPLGRPAIIGETITFRIRVTNTGDVELATVPVEDVYETAYLSYVSSVPASDDNVNDGVINWADIGPLAVGASTQIVATFTGAADTLGAERTNVVVTTPTTPPDAPPVPPQTNDAPYEVDTPASLGDFVWLDVNGDGIQGNPVDEPGIENVLVTLYDADTNALDTTTTDVNGAYAFTNLVPGTYFVGFMPPAGYEITLQDQGGDDALDSDADRVTGYTVPTVLTSGENDTTWDAGLYEPASLGNFVWDDLNADGIQDAGELGIENVTVHLLTNGTIIASTTTDVNGVYAFTDLIPGDYSVQVVPPAGYDVSPQDEGADDAVDSDIDPVTGQTTTITLVSGQNDPDWDGGLYLPASLGDYVWLDVDGDGIQGNPVDEPGIENVLVTLYDADTNALDTTTTDANGAYAFTNLVPGTYFVGFTPPPGYAITLQDQGADDALDSDADRTTGFTVPTVLISGENDPTWDAGLYEPASLGDFVWDDLNGDGIQDAGEPGIPGVTVRLYDGNTNLLDTTLTDGLGAYAFTDLIPGDYFVEFVRPAGYQFTSANEGADDALDSDADPLTGRTQITTLISGENDPTWDAGFYRPASLGDYVWLDENWDGIQDPGEAGIPNVTVELLDSGMTVIATTVTDLNGLYLFTDLPPGDYTVRVDTSTLAPELAANQTYDLDGTLDHQTTVGLTSGEQNLNLDFGYNWNPDGDPLGSIGDRIWVDADADGAQDPGEPGIPDVTVNLFIDSEGNGSYTTVVATTTTDAAGLYIFPGLDAGSYVVRVDTTTLPLDYVQTGDPDHFGTDSTANPSQAGDHQTTAPIVLAPGDVFVNADFGYVFPTFSNLGDLVYFDANADGVFNPADGDYAIPGVTVVLLNSNGLVIASTVTGGDAASTNNYLFTGLPAGEYTVWINDTGNVLSGLVQTGDPDGGLDSRSTTTLDGVTDDLLQDHGYTPDGHEPGLGLIGDTVFLDRDNDGLPGPGEGIQGVTVRLYDYTGLTLLATTVTDPNGLYYFGGLPLDETYVVRVDTTTLPNGGTGLTNTVDPDTANPGDSQSTVAISAGNPIDLDQDFGYVAAVPNAIGGTLWRDCNADGILDPDEDPRWEGVKIVLRDAYGNIVGTMFTDVNGDYLFEGLPDGVYTVDVADVNNVLLGFWHSRGPNPGDDNNSQEDPYTVMVAGGETNTTGDFGYYVGVTELGDYIWYDINGNGIQDGGEPGLANVRVTLTITYPNGDVIEMHTLTDENGRYRFANLLVDERYAETTLGDPAVEGLPRFTVSVDSTQAILVGDGYDPTLVGAGDGENDSRDHTGTFAELRKCGRPVRFDFGYTGGPLLAVIGNVDAFTRDGQTIVRWETIESWGTAGFWLDRLVGEEWVRISPEMLPFPLFGVAPIVYEETDPGAEPGGTYVYRLVELENDGDILYYGPYTLTVDGPGRTYEDWAAANFTVEQLADPAISGEDADPDGDGLTNGQEFLAGTDPLSADSVLQITDVRRVDGGLELRWQSVAGRFYKIALADRLGGLFLPLEHVVLATDETGRTTLPVDFQDRQMYFQVIVVGGETSE